MTPVPDRARPLDRRWPGGEPASTGARRPSSSWSAPHVEPEGDIHASADYRRMLGAPSSPARALGRGHRRPRRGGRRMSRRASRAGEPSRRAAARHPAAGQRRPALGAGTGPPPALRLPAPRPRPHRHPRRLRARRLRRLHGARRRPADALVPDVRGHRAGPRDHHGRGHRQRPRGDEPGAAGVRRVPRAAVRLLHPGLHHDDHRLPRREPRPRRRRRPARRSRATCAAAPATRTSSRPSAAPPRSAARAWCSSPNRCPATRAGWRDEHPAVRRDGAAHARTRGCSPATAATSTTSATTRSRPPSCAARTPTPGSSTSTSTDALEVDGVVAIYT